MPNNIVEMLIFFYIINFITQQLLLLLHRITNCIQRHADQHMQQYVIVIAEYLADSRCCGLGNIIYHISFLYNNIIKVCNIIYIYIMREREEGRRKRE